MTSGGNGGDGGSWAFIPNFYFARGVTDNLKLGLAVSPLFGLKTEYDKTWVGRYHAIKSELKTININPSIAFKANERLSLGFGVSAMYSRAELTNAVDINTLTGGAFQNDALATVKGSDWGLGWNVGAIFQLTDATRLGLAYRSAIHQKLEGDVSFAGVPVPLSGLSSFQKGDIEASFVTPESVSVSMSHKLDNKWDVMGDIIWTRWSRFKELNVVRESGATVSRVPEHWHNVTRLGVGASYKYSDIMKLRAGIAYDESPISSSAYRTPRVPDSDRIWLSLGLNYELSPTSSFDIAYTYISFRDSKQDKVNDTSTLALQDNLKGDYDNYANILSAQYKYSF